MRLPRYLAVAAPRDPFGFRRCVAPIMAETGLPRVFSGPGLDIYGDGPAPVLLAGNSGIVLGPIFRKDGAMDGVTVFEDDQLRRIAGSRGKQLIEHCWGDYLAFIADGGAASVMRPPLSYLGCLHAGHRGVTLIASDLELLARCGVPVEEPDWSEIASHLRTDGLRGPATCVQGVGELLWGNRLVVTKDETHIEPCWLPWDFALAARSGSSADLARELRELTLACVKAQVRHLVAVDAMLSGGLDSSILTACLAGSGVQLTCLNITYGDANGDERLYARAVAAHLGVPLFEIEPRIAEVDLARCATPGLARPIARAFLQTSRLAKHRLAAATGAANVVDGGGGDSLFASMQSAAPIADRLLREGPGRGLLKTAADVARLTGASLPQAVTAGLRRAYLRRRAHRWPVDERFLSREGIAIAGKRSHPWLKAPRGALPGSATHIANMIVVENLIEIANSPVAEWSPLMAQPLLEFCLSVPSWLWFENGHNRALARRAFEDLLPPQIAWRRGKGTPDGFVAALFETNRDRLSDLLIGGMIDRAGLLDSDAMRAALAPDLPIKGYDYTRLLRIADVEAWLRALKHQVLAPSHAPPPAPTAVTSAALPPDPSAA